MNRGVSALWKEEDWWAVWFGAIIIAGTLLGWVPKIPKVGSWSDDPMAAFMSGKLQASASLPDLLKLQQLLT